MKRQKRKFLEHKQRGRERPKMENHSVNAISMKQFSSSVTKILKSKQIDEVQSKIYEKKLFI